MNGWTGNYHEIREFAFLLRIDGSIHRYPQMWQILGAQPAKRKRDWVEVEIGTSEKWLRQEPRTYKQRCAHEVEIGLRSMVELCKEIAQNQR